MKRIVGLGANVLDTLICCNSFPPEDTKQRADSIRLAGGGPVGNALVVMSKLGICAEAIGAFANDNAGIYLTSDLSRHGVSTRGCVMLDGKTSFTSYIIISEKNGTRTCVFDRGSVPDDEKNVALDVIDGADILHLDGNYLSSAISAAKYARQRGVKVSLDAGGLYEGIERLLPLVDILIPSAEFAMGLTGESNPKDALLKLHELYSPEVLVVTDGARGGYYYKDGEAHHYDSVKVTVVDTNGAGDTFHGAFVSAYAMGESVEYCCRFASAVAGYKCSHMGARDYELSMEIAKSLIK